MGRAEHSKIVAIGLDLGNTLVGYRGVPMSWQERYPDALQAVLERISRPDCGRNVPAACERLLFYNTRIHPREVEIPADTIFADVLTALGADPVTDLEPAVDAFFGHFRQTWFVYDDTMPFLSELQRHGIPAGVLTDVPYGMPKRWLRKDTEPIDSLVDAVLSSVDVGYRKPNKTGFLALAQALGAARQTWRSWVTRARM